MVRLTMASTSVWQSVLSVFKRGLRVYMSTDERLAMEVALGFLGRPLSVLEWGSGGSTLHFGRLLPPGSQWLTIEHHQDWAKKVRQEIAASGLTHVELAHVPTNGVHIERSSDGLPTTFRDYIQYPETTGKQFDFALVDGRARVACSEAGWRLMKPDGIMALHDAQRAEYSPLNLPGATRRVRIRDPRKKRDGGDIELHFYMRDPAAAGALTQQLREKLASVVKVTEEPLT